MSNLKKTFNIQNAKQIFVNGKQYSNMDEVPDDIKGILADKDGNGMPDIVDNMMANNISNEIDINGVKYSSWDDVPDEFQTLRNLWNAFGGGNTQKPTSSSTNIPNRISESPPSHNSYTPIQVEKSKIPWQTIIILVLIGIIFYMYYIGRFSV